MAATATPTPTDAILPLRNHYRQEMNCQVVSDSLHRRTGWTKTWALHVDGAIAGFGSMAMGGPWDGKPTLFEFFVLPPHRGRAFELFEALMDASGATLMAVQSSDLLITAMLHTYARDIVTDALVFRDGVTTTLPANGAVLEQVTPEETARVAIAERQGGPEYRLRVGDDVVATGGILFHYNVPYGDIYMETMEPFRRQGFGAYMVQELKRIAYELDSIPAARTGATNIPSRRTLQKAGLVPYACRLSGTLAR